MPPSELAEFRRWFAEFDSAAWDKQIEQDAASGKLDQLAAEALADYQNGSVLYAETGQRIRVRGCRGAVLDR